MMTDWWPNEYKGDQPETIKKIMTERTVIFEPFLNIYLLMGRVHERNNMQIALKIDGASSGVTAQSIMNVQSFHLHS